MPTLTLKQENCIILGIFIILFFGLVCINIFAWSGKAQITASPAGKMVNMVVAPAAGDRKVGQKVELPGYGGQENTRLEWGRDPFVSSRIESKAAGSENKAGELSVTLILMSDTTKITAINNKIFQEGDKVQDEKIMRIKSDGVVLEKNGVQRFLPLRKDSIQFQEEENNAQEK